MIGSEPTHRDERPCRRCKKPSTSWVCCAVDYPARRVVLYDRPADGMGWRIIGQVCVGTDGICNFCRWGPSGHVPTAATARGLFDGMEDTR